MPDGITFFPSLLLLFHFSVAPVCRLISTKEAEMLTSIVLFLLLGLLGIGGGVIIIPILMFRFGLTQHEAQGTTLALMVPPIGLLAALEYFHKGDVNLSIAGFICAGFFLGALAGARLASLMSSRILAKVFALAMALIALKMLLA